MLFLSMLGPARAFAFSAEVHLGIDDQVLVPRGYGAAAIARIGVGNLLTDDDEFDDPAAHFDSEKFADGSRRLRAKIDAVVAALIVGRPEEAREQLGRGLHAVQDFFSHSNFVENTPDGEIDLLALQDPDPETPCALPDFRGPLTSGYFPDYARPAPHKCVHAELNKDSADAGSRHELARAAAARHATRFVEQVEERLRPLALLDSLRGGPGRSGPADPVEFIANP